MKRVTSFSFKGGAGRTVSTANLGAALAMMGRRVCVVDLDVEAPGLHYVYEIEGALETAKVFLPTYLRGDADLSELLTGGAVVDVVDARRLCDPEGELKPLVFPNGGQLVYVGSHVSDQALPLEDELMDVYSALVRLSSHFADEGFDYFIMDAPSGFGTLAALALELADTEHGAVLWFLRMSAQHVRGTVLMGSRIQASKLGGKFPHTTFQLVAAAVPSESEIEGIENQSVRDELILARTVANRALRRLEGLSPSVFEIPEIIEFKWKECVMDCEALLSGPYGELALLLERLN